MFCVSKLAHYSVIDFFFPKSSSVKDLNKVAICREIDKRAPPTMLKIFNFRLACMIFLEFILNKT